MKVQVEPEKFQDVHFLNQNHYTVKLWFKQFQTYQVFIRFRYWALGLDWYCPRPPGMSNFVEKKFGPVTFRAARAFIIWRFGSYYSFKKSTFPFFVSFPNRKLFRKLFLKQPVSESITLYCTDFRPEELPSCRVLDQNFPNV